VYVTENGLADADDRRRRDYPLDHLRALQDARRDGAARIRGYFAWSLMDNFEWAAGYYPRFGFFGYNPDTLRRSERPSARTFRRIARSGGLPG
jgi:beta-glucosidase